MRLPTGPTARRSLIALITLGVILLLAATAIPPALGARAQQAYQDLLRGTVAALPPGWVLVEHYERGWFSSKANAELTRQPLPGQTPAGVSRIHLDSRIEQGPWAWFNADLFPALTQVHTRVEVLADPLRVPPLLFTTTIGANGSGLTRLLIPATEQSGAPDGFRLQSKDITGTARYRPNPRQLAADLTVPGLALLDSAGPIARLTDARLKADLTGWIGGLFTGRTSLEVESAELSPPPQPNANAKAALVQRLHLSLEQVPQGQAPTLRLDLRLDAAAELLRLGSVDYRSPVIGLAARSLDAQALAEINTALRTLADDGASRAMRGLVGATLLTQLLPRFLAAGPSLTLDPFTLTTPAGPVAAHLSLGAAAQGPGATGAAVLLSALLNRGKANWLTGLTGDGAIDLPQAIALEWLARADTAVPPAPAERLQTWIDGGWVSARDGRVTSTVRLADGQLSVNGKPVPLLRSVFGR
ncbi:DUF945 family protein [uncultured Thiodictyon sp.]|jgi:uncharacterized protein YdgA (DUF945 family)|uniref:DUF945 family protein n=1 Tax=uncultured Thiodictyon sp. TaxID=1846217 RepID=UPI0025E05F1C|nr:DUF945 family protein [uncultured Thiodictyon sp.]